MPKSRTNYRLFISAPSDVSAEVEVVKQTVTDVNILVKSLDVEFETFHWVDDVTPGATDRAQDRINAQAEGYDIIVAIFGARLGTPTGDHESGTTEEIHIARSNVGNLTFGDDSIIVLFKHMKIDLSYGDMEAAANVQSYRKSISGKIYFKEFDGDVELKESILKSLGPVIKRHILLRYSDHTGDINDQEVSDRGDGGKLGEEIVQEQSVEDILDEDHYGLLDYVALAESKMLEATSISEKINKAVNDVTLKFNAATEEVSLGADLASTSVMSRIMDDISDAMDTAAGIIGPSSSEMTRAFLIAIDALESALEIQAHDFRNTSDAVSIKQTADQLYENISSNVGGIAEFKSVLSATPRMNKSYNKAKIALLRAADELSSAMQLIMNRSAELSRTALTFIGAS